MFVSRKYEEYAEHVQHPSEYVQQMKFARSV